jgi:hypothetical protein
LPKKKEVELYVAVYDLHYPQYDKPTFNAIMDFLRRNPVDGFVWGGDQFDNAEISHHNKGKGLYKLPGSYAKNTTGFDKDILRVVESALPKGCEKVWIEGNHDHWQYEFVELHPELQNTIEREQLLQLQERGWKFIPMGTAFQHGELSYVHGETLSGMGNQSPAGHAKKAVETYCCNVLYGHFHNPMSYTKILPTDTKRKWMGWCSPIAGHVNPTYLQNRPTAWLTGFTIVEYRQNGYFNLYPVIIIDGKFSFAGKIYGGK